MRSGGRGPGWGSWAVAVCIVLVLAVDAVVLVSSFPSNRPPTFERGGTFGRVEPDSGTAPVETAPSTSVASATTTSTRPRSGATTSTTSTSRPTTEGAGGATPRPARPGAPALGTYTFMVSGSEAASVVGSRSFPPQMRLVAHRRGGMRSDEVVLDQDFSADHEEREIARYTSEGVILTDEAGSFTFGLITQESDVTYDPPMVQIPFPLVTGTTRSGTSAARQRDGTVARVDDWTSRILGQETITVAGAAVATWTVQFERRSRPGGQDQVVQTTRYWFDPVRGMSVKWEETVHGERTTLLIRGSYDGRYVATLQAFRPA